MPIMVKSQLCILNNLDDTKCSEFGECPYDQGGYFIIKGKEKVFLSQEKKINNILYINRTSGSLAKINPIQCIFKSISTEGFQSSRTNAIALTRVTNEFKPSNTDMALVDKTYHFHVTVRLLGINFNIPLFILYRALGKTTDKDILSFNIEVSSFFSDTFSI